MVDPYDPGTEDKLWKNPFTSTNPLDAMLNFGNPGNSNNWKNDDSISLFTKGRDIIPPKSKTKTPSTLTSTPTSTPSTPSTPVAPVLTKTDIADKVKQIQDKVKIKV